MTTTTSASTTVDQLLAGIGGGAVPAGLFTDDAVLDAVVPNWRFAETGSAAVAAVYGGWFHRPVRFAELRRHPIAGGEVVEYTLNWVEDGLPHASRHVHVLHLAPDGRIASDHVWCGGIWPAPLLARMEAAGRARWSQGAGRESLRSNDRFLVSIPSHRRDTDPVGERAPGRRGRGRR